MTASAVTTATSAPPFNSTLRRVYVARFAFAVIWALLLIPNGKHTGAALTVLLVVYPLADAAAVLAQLRSAQRTQGPRTTEWVNVAVSIAVAIALGWASASSLGIALAVWGVWAAVAGITQLVTAIAHRGLGGQVPQIVSGAISVVAGAAFLAQAAKSPASISGIGGYAILGGVFFLISALRLRALQRRAS